MAGSSPAMTGSGRFPLLLWPPSRRRCLTCRVDRAHNADSYAVRVLKDRVARAPKGIVWRREPGMTCARELRIYPVHFLARSDPEPQYDTAHEVGMRRPARVPVTRQ